VLIEVVVEDKQKRSGGRGVDGHGDPIDSEFQHHVLLFALVRRRYRDNISLAYQADKRI
jgi:hypothetical protein